MSMFAVTAVSLLAQGDYQHMGRRFRRGGAGLDSAEFILLVGGLIAVAVTAVLLARFFARRHEQGYESPPALFSELCRAHGLKWTSRRILRKLAAHHQILPCQLFLEPARFSLEPQQGELARYASELADLQTQLFATKEQQAAEEVETRS